MSKIARKTLIPFGSGGVVGDFEQFGSRAAGSPVYTQDPAVIQALAAWANGWKAALLSGNRAPICEDQNALDFVTGYMLGYLFQEGVPEWDSDTTYYKNSIVKKPGTMELYGSFIDDNQGNALPVQTDDTNWHYLSYAAIGVGTTVARPTSPVPGFLYINTSISTIQEFTGGVWVNLSVIPAGSVGTTQIADGAVTIGKLQSLLAGNAASVLTSAMNTSVKSLGSLAYTGRPMLFLAKIAFQYSAAGGAVSLGIRRDGALVDSTTIPVSATGAFSGCLYCVDTPAAGNHTYDLAVFSYSGMNIIGSSLTAVQL